MDLAKNSFGGGALRGPAGQILLPQPTITTFLSGFHGKTAQKARRRRFFWKIVNFKQFSSNFLVFPRW